MTTSSTAKTKKITVDLPIEYWWQLHKIEGIGHYRKMPLNEIARQFVIERLDKECLTQKSLPTQRGETCIGEINLDDIGIEVDVISDINKTSFKPTEYKSLSIKKEKRQERSFRPFRPFRLALFTVMSFLLFA